MYKRYALCMPVYNEADGIEHWISEILLHERSKDFDIVIVNDRSTDSTLQIMRRISKVSDIIILENEVNLGHGPSLGVAINYAIANNYKFILTADGDGQISANDLFNFFTLSLNSDCTYSEAARKRRVEPWYRKIISLITRLMVFKISLKLPKDANTPFRFYSLNLAQTLWNKVPNGSIVPNLLVSIYARQIFSVIPTFEVISRTRRGNLDLGSTWKTKGKEFRLLPPAKLIRFCRRAIDEIAYINPHTN